MQPPELTSEAELDTLWFIGLFLHGMVWLGNIKEHSSSHTNSTNSREHSCIRVLTKPQQGYRRLLKRTGIDFSANQPGMLIEHTNFTIVSHLHNPATTSIGIIETNPEYIQCSGKAGQHTQTLCHEAHQRIEPELSELLEYYGYS